jgi:hypothetical protein
MNSLFRRMIYSTGVNWFQIYCDIRYAIPSSIGRAFDRLPLKGDGAEIGVYSGFHARVLLKKRRVGIVHLVDPYSDYDSESAVQHLDDAEWCAHRLLRRFGDRVVWHRTTLQKANLPQLGWAYIDGNHEFDYVYSDITTLWPMIQHGGFIGGHDFHPIVPGVCKAVVRFAHLHELQLNVQTPDWWMVKPF